MLNSLSNTIRSLGAKALRALEELGRMTLFLVEIARQSVKRPFEWGILARQIRFVGSRSIIVIGVAGGFVGMVVALQFYDTLVRFGSASLLGSAVGLSLVRELGPVLTALIIIGRAGSATCAEIAIMRSDNQIDALESMAIDPYRYLMVPRLLAFLFCVPLLTAIFDVVGIIGGWLIGTVIFGLSEGTYFQSMADSVIARDLAMGAVKSIIFAAIIAWTCMGKGFLMHLNRSIVFGAEGVSRVTTDAVVVSSIAILFADYIISAVML